ncbi:MAG: porin [Campylobacterota bacterium]|nr:porin [Campylobacterota bacterium]MDQ1337768.1 porin [Campylobacterota bacterium]
MKDRDIVLILVVIASVIASAFVYEIKNVEKKNIELGKGNLSSVNPTHKTAQEESQLVSLEETAQKDINVSDLHAEEFFLAEAKVDIINEQESQTDDVELQEEDKITENEIALRETEILEEIALKKEVHKKKKEKDIEETTSTDDVDSHMEEIITDREGVLRDERIPEWFKNSIRGLNYIKEEYGIDMGIAYRGIAQYEGVSENFAGGGNLDLFGRYKPNATSTIGFNLRSRHAYGPYSSSEYAENVGSLYAVSPSYEKLPLFVTELWYQYKLDSITARFGFVNRNSFIDNSFYKNQNRYFLSSTFSLAPYNSLPDNGLGLVLRYKQPSYYALAYVADSDVKKGESLGNILERDIKLYSALEFGLTPENAKYYVTLWNRDSQDATEDKNRGAIFSLNKAFENNYKAFAKYALSESSIEKEHFEFGFGRRDLYREDDLISMAFSISRPSEDLRTQSTAELFYRYDVYYGVQLTTSMQIINHPSKSEENWALLPGVRVRMIF